MTAPNFFMKQEHRNTKPYRGKDPTFNMEYDGINDERPAECPDCGLRYMQEDCGGGGCPRCEEEDEEQ